jgi:hypothetical protein
LQAERTKSFSRRNIVRQYRARLGRNIPGIKRSTATSPLLLLLLLPPPPPPPPLLTGRVFCVSSI